MIIMIGTLELVVTYKLIIAYDGTAYAGWQQQAHVPSVLGTIEKTFARVCKAPAQFLGASRTDAGVHALGQVVRCITPLSIDPNKLVWILNNSLPIDIHVRSATIVPDTFHPMHNVDHKIYYYHIFSQRPLPFFARYGWYYRTPIDSKKLEEALQIFVGTHDFNAFCCAEDKRTDTIRTIDAISVQYIKRFNAYRITVKGHSFLRHMIRRMVGAAVQVASNPNLQVNLIQQLLLAKNPQHALLNAPAEGLLLYRITYING